METKKNKTEKDELGGKKIKFKKLIKKNKIRKLSNFIYDKFELKDFHFNQIYLVMHSLLIFLISFILLFSMNITHLIITLIVVSLDAFSVVVLHHCPLTILEQKYLKHSSSDVHKKWLKSLGISYNCNHVYENQVELMINVWCLIAGKCLCIIFFQILNIRLPCFGDI